MHNYLEQKVTAFVPLENYRTEICFSDGFKAVVDLEPLLARGPLFESLKNLDFFRSVVISRHGVPEWGVELDLSPGSLRAWCEAGRMLGPKETDEWITQRSESTGARVAEGD